MNADHGNNRNYPRTICRWYNDPDCCNDPGGEEQVSAREDGFSFENVTKPIQKIAQELSKIIETVQPDKASVTLGFEVATSEGQLTALLVKGTATANLAVTLEWVKEKREAKPYRPRLVRKR